MSERLVLVGSLMMSASVAVFAETAPNDARGNGLVTVESVLEQWGRAGGPADLDGDGTVGGGDLLAALAAGAPASTGRPIVHSAGGEILFLGVVCEPFVDEDWAAHGYEGLITYRLYAEFEEGPDAGILSGFGIDGHAMSWESSGGEFYNDLVYGGLTAPVDGRSGGIWSSQWDTYVTINATAAAGDVTNISPGFAVATENLERDFETANAGWFVTPDDDQARAIDGRVLLAQITVEEPDVPRGVINLLTLTLAQVYDLPFICSGDALGACCLFGESCFSSPQEFCEMQGGVYFGDGSRCALQTFERSCHPGDDAQHCVEAVLVCPEQGAAQVCEPGPFIDAWSSPGAGKGQVTSFQDFGAGEAIPGGFFGVGSDPFTGMVLFESAPLGTVDLSAYGGGVVDVGEADTLVHRAIDPFDRCTLPSDEFIAFDIGVVALGLASSTPILVTYDGGQRTELWDVAVSHSEHEASWGVLKVEKTHCNGGEYLLVYVRVWPRFEFTRNDDPETVRVLDTARDGFPPVELQLSPGTWVVDVDATQTVLTPYCTAFHPGLSEDEPTLDCDCNGNGQHDKCDIEQGLDTDCDGNVVPDMCDLARGARDCNNNGVLDACECPGDVTGDCTVNYADIALVLAGWGPCGGCPIDIDGSGVVDTEEIIIILTSWGPCGG